MYGFKGPLKIESYLRLKKKKILGNKMQLHFTILHLISRKDLSVFDLILQVLKRTFTEEEIFLDLKISSLKKI